MEGSPRNGCSGTRRVSSSSLGRYHPGRATARRRDLIWMRSIGERIDPGEAMAVDTTRRTILVTGFEPFGGISENPSQAVVEALNRTTVQRRTELVTDVLPCEFRAAGERIVSLIREYQSEAVLSLGLAASAAAIRLERHALNLNDAIRPDNAGDLASGR